MAYRDSKGRFRKRYYDEPPPLPQPRGKGGRFRPLMDSERNARLIIDLFVKKKSKKIDSRQELNDEWSEIILDMDDTLDEAGVTSGELYTMFVYATAA